MLKPLCALETRNLLGWNVFRHSRDRKQRRRFRLMAGVWAFLVLVMGGYSGALCWGLTALGLPEAVPVFLTVLSSLVIFFLGVFQAGGTVFRREGYDMLCALPVRPAEIVLARLFRFYLFGLAAAALVMLPGLGVYAAVCAPGWAFYPLALGGLLLTPLLPMSAALAVGAGITALTARMKGKSLISAVLSIIAVLVILFATSQSYRLESLSLEAAKKLVYSAVDALGRAYPPARWLGTALSREALSPWLLFAALSLAIFALAAGVLSTGFRSVSQALFGVSASHNYRLGSLKSASPLMSLIDREFRRYLASSIYVVNTILGPILATVLAGASLFGKDALASLPLPVDVETVLPFLFSGVFCLMNPASVSISMEGKSFWIVKSLPLSAKTVLDGKLAMNLLLDLPFYLLSEILLFLAWRPAGLNALLLILLPGGMILFSCVLGLFVNLRLPLLDWESEVRVVKQSASAMLGGMGGFLLSILGAALTIAVPGQRFPIQAGMLVLVLLAAGGMYASNSRRDLREIR